MDKMKVAFICVHNSCRSQIAEALGKYLASDVFESYSAGTETVSCRHREDWGLEDPTGKSDEEFQKTIKLIDSKIMDLANRIKVDFITQSVV